jgi:hypothetical protein
MPLITNVNEKRYHFQAEALLDESSRHALNGWMNRRKTLHLLAASAVAWPAAVFAQHRLEIIALRHRTADDLIPVLRPLLEPGGTLSAHGNQLFVRASPANVAELRRVLESIDRPQRRLQISVRFDDSLDASRRALGASGRVGTDGTRIEVHAGERATATNDRIDQRVQVLEGGRAMIYTGQSRGVPQRQVIRTPTGVVAQETIVVQERATGFEVVPRLAGDSVQLEIAPQRESGERFQRIGTTVQARLGEWVEVGGAATTGARSDQGVLSSGRSGVQESRRVWLLVEALPN